MINPLTRAIGGAALPLLALLGLAGCDLAAPAPAAVHTADTGTARAALADLPVKGRAPKTGYSRDEFPHWSDLDGDGCDSRAETLQRDAIPDTLIRDRHQCVVGATIQDPYTGRQITEQPGRGSDVDIDHLVALSDAWQKGAQQLTRDEREQLANDPLNLAAVDDGLNRKKSDGDAATWLPPNKTYRCTYVAAQVAVKTKHQLWVTQAEHDAIARVLAGCPGQPLPGGQS
ncbi:MAG: HNH endonuclease family protein [Pseudonocardia sp.]|nr:HNH endonuclease family protein [Pseudonocardia sp.]